MVGFVVVIVALLLLVVRFLPAYLKFRRMELAIPGPPSLPFIGNPSLLLITEVNILSLVLGLWNSRTELCRTSFCGYLGLFVSDPDDIEQLSKRRDLQDKATMFYQYLEDFRRRGLITLNGADHRAHRKAIQPAFHTDVLGRYTEEFAHGAKRFVDGVVPNAKTDVVTLLRLAAGRVFFRTALVSEVDEVAEKLIKDMHHFLEFFLRVINNRSFKPWLWPNWLFYLTSEGRELRKRLRDLKACTKQFIASRKAQYSGSMSEENFMKSKPTLIDVFVRDGTLSDTDMLDEFHIFVVAAVETSSSALGWAFKVLSVRPEIQARLHREVAEVLGDKGVVGKAELDRLQYTERVLKETMRLLPPVPMTLRTNHTDIEFAGHTIPAGTTIGLNILGVHRDARHWPDPCCFDPDRFTPERSEGRHPFAYIPFSVGSRNCIGSRYAMMVMKSILATTVQRYVIDPVPDGHTDPSKFPMTVDMASRMLGGLRVIFRERSAKSL